MKKLVVRLMRQSPAMIVAMLALFVALTGTAVATTSALITGAQIKNSSITGADVKNRSLRPIDFRGSVRGPRGLTGPQGTQGAPGAKGDKGDKGDPATADGAAVIIGRLINAGGVTCLTGSASGISTTGACSITALRDASGVMPVDRVVRNLHASIPAAIGNGTRVILYRPNSGGILLECTIPAAQTTCTNTNGAAIVAGALLALEIDAVGGGALPASLGFGYETLSAAGAAVTAAPTTRAKTAASK